MPTKPRIACLTCGKEVAYDVTGVMASLTAHKSPATGRRCTRGQQAMPCSHGISLADTSDVLVSEDGRTSCCDACSTIFTDDQSEYCKCCGRTVTGYVGKAVFDMPVTIHLPEGNQ